MQARKARITALVLAVGLLAAARTWAVEPVNTGFFDDVAIEGYDPVAYFTQGEPVKGSKEHTFEWNGAQWRFASAGHRDLFAGDPEKYAPQYGGYCAYAVANGTTAGIDPEAWHIHEGRLYLNVSLSIRDAWRKDIPGHVARADANWPKLLAD